MTSSYGHSTTCPRCQKYFVMPTSLKRHLAHSRDCRSKWDQKRRTKRSETARDDASSLPSFLEASQWNELCQYAEFDYNENYDLEQHDDNGIINRQHTNDSEHEVMELQAAPVSAVEFREPDVLKTGRTTYKRIWDNIISQKKGLLSPFQSRKDFDVFCFIHKANLTRDEVGELMDISSVRNVNSRD